LGVDLHVEAKVYGRLVSTYQIADVAERSGFTPATLRYYEDIGLVVPAGRTPAGYRLYDDASLERLRFIARAKQLGCSLEEIADLAKAWDGGECGPVQDRLRAAVAAKIAEAQDRVAELTTFIAELHWAAVALERHRPDGPCDDDCGCASDTTVAGPPSVPLIAKADAAAAGVPIACTLGAGEMAGRLEAWEALLAENRELLHGMTARLPLEDGVRLEFGPNTDVTEIARLAAAEQQCCQFLGFALVIDSRGIALEIHAPAEAADVVTALFGSAA
jgi:MerR family transcriptional regulator, copper efflux regulator